MAHLPVAADYIVVGGGLTGCLIASRLRQSDKKPEVVLMEAGSDPSDNPAAAGFLSGLSLLGGEFDYVYQSDPVTSTANRVHSLNSGKALGGGSILNYGGWLRADAADYDEWAEVVSDGRWYRKSDAANALVAIAVFILRQLELRRPQALVSQVGMLPQSGSGCRRPWFRWPYARYFDLCSRIRGSQIPTSRACKRGMGRA